MTEAQYNTDELAEGDELTDTNYDTPITVTEVSDNGDVTVRAWIDQRHGQKYTTETYTGAEISTAFSDGIFVYENETEQ